MATARIGAQLQAADDPSVAPICTLSRGVAYRNTASPPAAVQFVIRGIVGAQLA
jgi:hypothetical protein